MYCLDVSFCKEFMIPNSSVKPLESRTSFHPLKARPIDRPSHHQNCSTSRCHSHRLKRGQYRCFCATDLTCSYYAPLNFSTDKKSPGRRNFPRRYFQPSHHNQTKPSVRKNCAHSVLSAQSNLDQSCSAHANGRLKLRP